MSLTSLPPPPRQRGVSLLEVLVALLVMSIGLIGLAALQAKSMTANRDGLYRIRAVHLADQIVESMRANPAGAAGYTGAAQSFGCSQAGTTAAVDCTPAQVAADDLWTWHNCISRAATGLPNGSGTVTANTATTPTTYTVTVTWRNSATPHSYRASFFL